MQTPHLPTDTTRTINLIVVHCSATPSGKRISTDSTTAAGVIDKWHAARGFTRIPAARAAFNYRLASIGYHYVIDIDGTVWTGRHLNEVGAHVQGYNSASVGICLVGGAERAARYTPMQWTALGGLVSSLQAGLHIPQVCGHRDLSPDTNGNGRVEPGEWLKTCPGFDVSIWLGRSMKPLPEHVCEVHA